MTPVDPSSPAVALAREALTELRAAPAAESGRGSYPWWVGRLEVVVETLLSVIDGPATVPPAEVAP